MAGARSSIRLLIFGEAVVFLVAALVRAGMLIGGYQHREARVAETVIASVLFLGAVLSWVTPSLTRTLGIAVQGFALLGTLVGVSMIIVGVGPRTILDVVYHLGIVGLLLWGVIVTVRLPAHDTTRLV
jgi:hypothetical protein